MAIDSASKRASALSAGVIALALVIPSGTIDQQARQTIVNVYSGILAGEAVVTPELSFAVFGAITDDGKGLFATITEDGRSVKGIITETGVSVVGLMNATGSGVDGPIN